MWHMQPLPGLPGKPWTTRALLSHSCSTLLSREMLTAALQEAKSVPWTTLMGHVLALRPHHGTAASLQSPPRGHRALWRSRSQPKSSARVPRTAEPQGRLRPFPQGGNHVQT